MSIRNPDEEQRFGGMVRLYGPTGWNNIRNASVLVAGVGGVGSWIVEGLARGGIGRLGMVDMDEICVTNINRQLQALTKDVGRSKIEALAERCHEIHPALEIELFEEFVTPENAHTWGQEWDLVIDATDSPRAKAALIAARRKSKLHILTIGGAGGQTDPTQVALADLSKTFHDPLAANVRSKLRKEYGLPGAGKKMGVPCVFSSEQLRYPGADGEVCAAKPTPEGGLRLDCAGGFGASVAVTCTFGMVAVAHAFDLLSQTQNSQQ